MFANIGALVFIAIVIMVLKVVGCWCCLAGECSPKVIMLLRVGALAGTIGFAFVAIEQNKLKILPSNLSTDLFHSAPCGSKS